MMWIRRAALLAALVLAPVGVQMTVLAGAARAQEPEDFPEVDLPVEVTIDVVTDFDDLDGAVDVMLDDHDDDVHVLVPGDRDRHDHDDGAEADHDDGDVDDHDDDIGDGFDADSDDIDEGHASDEDD